MSRRLVVLGRKKAGFRTVTQKIDTRVGENEAVIKAGLLPWFPKPAPEWMPEETDDDLLRKQQIEDAIARGDDL